MFWNLWFLSLLLSVKNSYFLSPVLGRRAYSQWIVIGIAIVFQKTGQGEPAKSNFRHITFQKTSQTEPAKSKFRLIRWFGWF